MHKDNSGDRLRKRQTQQLVDQFERMLQNNQSCFFEQESFENIIEFYEEKGNLKQALNVAELASEQYPFSVNFIVKKASLFFDAKMCDTAMQFIEQALTLAPNDLEASVLKADILNYFGKHKESVNILEQCVIFADKDEKADIYLSLAEVYETWEKEDKVYFYLKKTLQYNPTHETALTRIDYYIEQFEAYEESIALHQPIVDENPYCYLAWYNLGNAYYGLGLLEKAIEAYEFVMVINEKYDMAYRDCADAYYEINNFKKAVELYMEAIELTGTDDELLYGLGVCYFCMEDYPQAVAYLSKAIEENKLNQDALFQLGECYAALNDWNKALFFYNKALRLDGENDLYISKIAALYFRQENFEMAIMLYHDAIEINPNDISYWESLGCLYILTQQFDLSIDVLELGLDKFSEDEKVKANLYIILAAALIADGKKNEGFNYLHIALANKAKNVSLLLDLLPMVNCTPATLQIIEQYINQQKED